MNSLERFREAFTFQKPDHLPVHTFGNWEKTCLRWEREGMLCNWQETNFFGEDKAGGTGVHLGTDGFGSFFPRFELQVLTEDTTYVTFRDEHGRVVRQICSEVNINIAQYLWLEMNIRAIDRIMKSIDINVLPILKWTLVCHQVCLGPIFSITSKRNGGWLG
ncbi:MAG TPA: hypothetical protein VIO61_14930 [Anaerolineaceae bacterium]